MGILKKRKKTNITIRCIMLLCLAVMAFSAYKLWTGEREYAAGKKIYKDIAEQVAPADSPDDSKEDNMPKCVDLDKLSRISKEGIAWIYCPDTVIDYPVAQGTDNQYYLSHTVNGAGNSSGCIFLDFRNNAQFQDKNSILYGHHMNNGTMFGSIVNYKDPNYYQAHPLLYLYTKKQNYIVELFAGYVKENSDNQIEFKDDNEFLAFIDSIKQKSTFKSDVNVGIEDRILTMSTCAYDFEDARYVLVGKLHAVKGERQQERKGGDIFER